MSLHGYGRIGRSTQLLAGGGNRVLAEHVAGHFDVPGYHVVTDLDAMPRELRGLHPDNPVNRVRGGGTQLELSPRLRGISPRSAPAGRQRAVTGDIRADPGPCGGRAQLAPILGLVSKAITFVVVALILVTTMSPARADPGTVDGTLSRCGRRRRTCPVRSPWFATAA